METPTYTYLQIFEINFYYPESIGIIGIEPCPNFRPRRGCLTVFKKLQFLEINFYCHEIIDIIEFKPYLNFRPLPGLLDGFLWDRKLHFGMKFCPNLIQINGKSEIRSCIL